ncbi:hypothetical protein [Sphingobacterium thalpophilum]|uniref:hypothetical protein n=1 Tax=Sphingobacterium thalpophilum TaxID=259 RepID=UPI002D790D2F|nr:hypothetical protein [Sphingobacterium thalpophilum]
MIQFKKSFTDLLPYDRQQYIEFLFDEPDVSVKWYGISFQLDGRKINLPEFIKIYTRWLRKVIETFDRGSSWILNHDKTDFEWFPNNEDNLPSLRSLFKQRNISNKFKGALIFGEDDLIEFSKDLISYPYGVFNENNLFYTNIDISHGELPFVIKILDHLNIDLLSTDEQLLKKIVRENQLDTLILKPYRGTSL